MTTALVATGLMAAAFALLAVNGDITPGMMIAGSILMGRALAPIEQVVGGWSMVQRAQDGWTRLSELPSRRPPAMSCPRVRRQDGSGARRPRASAPDFVSPPPTGAAQSQFS